MELKLNAKVFLNTTAWLSVQRCGPKGCQPVPLIARIEKQQNNTGWLGWLGWLGWQRRDAFSKQASLKLQTSQKWGPVFRSVFGYLGRPAAGSVAVSVLKRCELVGQMFRQFVRRPNQWTNSQCLHCPAAQPDSHIGWRSNTHIQNA